MSESYYVKTESDEYEAVSIRPVQPKGWRDAWAVLRGRYRARVYRDVRLTMKGWDRELKRIWVVPMRNALQQPSPLASLFDRLEEQRRV